MKNFLLIAAVCLSLSGCNPTPPEEQPAYATWSVKNSTDCFLVLSKKAGSNLYLAPGDEHTIGSYYGFTYISNDKDQLFGEIYYRIEEISLYLDGEHPDQWEQLGTWKYNNMPKSHDKPSAEEFHFFNRSCWTYEFKEPDALHWTLDITPEILDKLRDAKK